MAVSVSGAYRRHALSAAFPDMPSDEFEELIEDVTVRGLRHAVILYQGQVLDGWHRYRACLEAMKRGAKVSLRIDSYSGSDPVGFVKSHNLMRRHLTGTQRAFCLAQLATWAPSGRPKLEKGDLSAPFSTVTDMAKEAGVSERTMQQAKRVVKTGSSALKEAVKEGDISLRRAADIATMPKVEQRNALTAAPAPRLRGATVPDTGAELQERYNTLLAEHEGLKGNRDDLAAELATCEAIRNGREAQEMNTLREHLRAVERRRDELMNDVSEMRKQIAYWKRQAEKVAA
jgi:hypothetical protein